MAQWTIVITYLLPVPSSDPDCTGGGERRTVRGFILRSLLQRQSSSRASMLLEQGDVGGAWIVLERAGQIGRVQATLSVTETYDPVAKWRSYGTRGDAINAQESPLRRLQQQESRKRKNNEQCVARLGKRSQRR